MSEGPKFKVGDMVDTPGCGVGVVKEVICCYECRVIDNTTGSTRTFWESSLSHVSPLAAKQARALKLRDAMLDAIEAYAAAAADIVVNE
jgi:hypothetical protein